MEYSKYKQQLIIYIYKLIRYAAAKGFLKWMPDEKYIKIMYKSKFNKELNLSNPESFNEKLQWLKLNYRDSKNINLVDKYEVRKYIESVLGSEYLIPLLGVYDSFDEINFDILPDKFVLKTTHDSGGVIVCRDKSKLDKRKVKKIISKSLRNNYFYWGREWPYKDIKPRIICEEMIETENNSAPIDYKFHCFNGNVDNVMLCVGRETGNTKFYFFNEKWELLRYNKMGKEAAKDFTLDRPDEMNRMFEIARILSKNLPFVRVDLYCENKKIYFGELTFFPESGFDSNLLIETDKLFGEKIDLNILR